MRIQVNIVLAGWISLVDIVLLGCQVVLAELRDPVLKFELLLGGCVLVIEPPSTAVLFGARRAFQSLLEFIYLWGIVLD